jgi:FOG: CheY-like receiver
MVKKDRVKVLIVEDEKIVAMDIKAMLERLGYDVPTMVSTKEEAAKKIEETDPDLVLMDIMLNGAMDGVDIADEIRTRFKIPVIYLTAYGNESTLDRAKATAPYGYILKPLEEKDLHINIEIALYKHRLETKIREEAENSLATILRGTEIILEEGSEKHDRETLRKVELIKSAAYAIDKAIEKL